MHQEEIWTTVDILEGYRSLNEGCATANTMANAKQSLLCRAQDRPTGKAEAMRERGADAMQA